MRVMLTFMATRSVSNHSTPFHENQWGYKSSLFGFLSVLLELHVLILVGDLWLVFYVAAGMFVSTEEMAEVVAE